MNKIRKVIDDAESIRQTNPAEALRIFEGALHQAINARDEENITAAYFNIAIAYLNLSNFSDSLKNFIAASETPHAAKDKKLYAEILRGFGTNYFRTYNYKEALRYYSLSEQASIESGNTSNLYHIYMAFGSLFNRLKLIDRTLEYSLKALAIARDMNDSSNIQYSLMSIGACHYQLHNFAEGEKYLLQSLEYSSNPFAEANAYHFLSLIFNEKGNSAEAKRLSQKQADICMQYNFPEFEALSYRFMGDVMLKEGSFDSALEYFNKASALLDKIGEKIINFTVKQRIIDTFENKGEVIKTAAMYKELYNSHIEHLEKNVMFRMEQINVQHETEKIKGEIEAERETNKKLTLAINEVNALNAKLHDLHEEKNELMSILAHDLKNPLQSIYSSGRLIEDHKDNSSMLDELCSNIKTQSERMFSLINRLLDYKSIEQGLVIARMLPMEPREICHKLVIDFTPLAAKKSIKLECSIETENVSLVTDKELLYQVLDNLLSNAIKFSPFEKKVFLNCRTKDNNFQIEIEDEGPGFTEKDKAKIFSSFAKLSAQPTGSEHSTGLGLAIAKKLCDMIGARLTLASTPGEGAKFTVTLPLEGNN
ncbi:MAG: tetratricopeptide repeat-containing sensor histidine kinase [Ignavibacteria bacterium]|nr:tetratricopeptide repeat-containing sensor histidine kinase [Ignavibacteria bacterium]